jgi:hypothetical protein
MSALGLDRLPGRCANGYDHHKQPGLCPCPGLAAKAAGQAQATAAHPDERAAVDAAIRQLAATGRPFSSNDARSLHGIKGPVVGAAFSAAAKAGLIRRVGYEASTSPETHAHPVAMWLGRAA